jgi:hypothetical protein
MELQDLVPAGVTSQLRFATVNPGFVDRRGALIESLLTQGELTEWRYGEDFLEVFRRDQSVALFASSRDLRAIFEHFEDRATVVSRTRDFLGATLEELAVTEIGFIGVRSYWLAAADSFADLNEWLLERLSPPLTPFFDVVGSKPTDAGWVLEFREKDPKHNLKIGPMTPAQATAQFFRDNDEENFPPQFLFLDIDRIYNEEVIATDKALERWEKSFTRNFEIGEKLGELLNSRA